MDVYGAALMESFLLSLCLVQSAGWVFPHPVDTALKPV